jgi:hypothetical protein
VAAQLAVQSTVRSAQYVAMPAWTSVGSTSAGSGEADLVRAAQPFLQDFFDNRDRKKIASSVAEAALGRQASGSWAWSSSVTAQSIYSGGSTEGALKFSGLSIDFYGMRGRGAQKTGYVLQSINEGDCGQ